MAPVKSQGSSRRKGKEAISNPSTALDVGKKAKYSESKHSDEEEAQCNPNSECAPLINQWYDIHPHFLKIPSNYVSPQPGHVLLALSWRNPNVS